MKRQTIDDSTSYRRKGGPTGRKLEIESRCKNFLYYLCVFEYQSPRSDDRITSRCASSHFCWNGPCIRTLP